MSARSDPPPPDLVTVEVASRRLGVSRDTLMRRVETAKLVRVNDAGGRVLLLWRDVRALWPPGPLPVRTIRSGPSQEALDQLDRLIKHMQ